MSKDVFIKVIRGAHEWVKQAETAYEASRSVFGAEDGRTLEAGRKLAEERMFLGKLDEAEELASSIYELDDYQVIACRDVATVSYTFKDRERSRKAGKIAAGVVGTLIVFAVLATCIDEDSKCDFLSPIWDQ